MTCRKTISTFARLLASGSLAVSPVVAWAQASPSPHTSATRYDAAGRVTGTISADPDGVGVGNPFLATRTTYDARGLATKVETGTLATWQSEAVRPADWGGNFTPYTWLDTNFDQMGRKLSETVRGSNGIATSLIQFSYDDLGRLACTAVRMNAVNFSSPPASACTLGSEGSQGPDRITRNIYDTSGKLLQVRKAVGTTIESADVTYDYTPNRKIKFVVDANGNRAQLAYDGHDRQSHWYFPSTNPAANYSDTTPANAIATSGAVNTGDYEQYSYDDGGNRTSFRKRDGLTITYQYDALNRMTAKVVPDGYGLAASQTRDVYYDYDLRGLVTRTRFDATGEGDLSNSWTGFGELETSSASADGATRTLTSYYDANGNRVNLLHPGNAMYTYVYDGLNRFAGLRDPYSNTLVSNTFDARGTLGSSARISTAPDQSWTYDPVGRLTSNAIMFGGPVVDATWSFTRNNASQLQTQTLSNDGYSWNGHIAADRTYARNGLNQYSNVGGFDFCYDPNGNLTADGANAYLYDVENRLVEMRARSGGGCPVSYGGQLKAQLRYDPVGRLYEVRNYVNGAASGTRTFLHDGDAIAAEYDGSGAMIRRHIHGPAVGVDDPLVTYDSPYVALYYARVLYADPRGSIVLRTDSTGYGAAINTYDEYGIPGSGNIGTFQYTGQVWLPELGMYYYKARIYSPSIGRFLQTDPIGYEDQFNLYVYVGNDPINNIDSNGERAIAVGRVIWQVARGEGMRAISRNIKEFRIDWSTLNAGSKATFGQQISAAVDILVGTDLLDSKEGRRILTQNANELDKTARGLREQADAHREKLKDYQNDPDGKDNKGHLEKAGSDEARRQSIIRGREQNLRRQIDTFERDANAAEEAARKLRELTRG